MKTAYEVLGVSKTATQDEIKNAYRKFAKKFHPDLNPGSKDAEKNFKEINQANEHIGTPEARAAYDREEGAEARAQANGRGPGAQDRSYYYHTQGGPSGGRYSSSFDGVDEDLFESVFGARGGAGGAQARASKPRDENFQMEVEFRDSILGAEREITLPNQKRLRITIPPGIESGKKLRFAGQSSEGGDVLIEVKVKPSERFERVDSHIEIEVPISVSEALLGAEIKVPTLDGMIWLKVPAGVNSGQKLRIAGKGVPSHGYSPAGDERVILKIVTPKNIDAEFKAAVEAWNLRQPFKPRTEGASS